MLWKQVLSAWTNLKVKLIKQNKECKKFEKLASDRWQTMTNKEKQLEALEILINPNWDKFIRFCRLYKIEEAYSTEARNINQTIYQEFPNSMSEFENNLKEKGTNEYRKFELKDNLIAYGFSKPNDTVTHFTKLIRRVYDKWRSELYHRN